MRYERLLARFALPATLAVLLAVVATGSLWGTPQQDDAATPSAPQWQFATIKVPVDTPNSELGRKVLQLGRDGWDLVSVENFARGGTTTHTAFYFKRPL